MEDSLTAPLYLLAGLAGSLVGIVLGSLVAAIWLRLAVVWLGFPQISFLSAFKSALIANFTVLMFNFSVSLNHGLMSRLSATGLTGSGRTADFNLASQHLLVSQYVPLYFLFAVMFGLVITAAVFCRTIPGAKDDPPLSFLQGLALAAFYQALSIAFMLALALVAFCIVVGWTSFI